MADEFGEKMGEIFNEIAQLRAAGASDEAIQAKQVEMDQLMQGNYGLSDTDVAAMKNSH